MGCSPSVDKAPEDGGTTYKPPDVGKEPEVISGKIASDPPPLSPNQTVKVGGSELNKMLAEMIPLCCHKKVKEKGLHLIACVARPDGKVLEFGCKGPNGEIYAFEMSEPQLSIQVKNTPLPTFLENLKSAFNHSILKLDVAVVATLQFKINSKPPGQFVVAMTRNSSKATVYRIFLTSLYSFFNSR
eukprot:386402_1